MRGGGRGGLKYQIRKGWGQEVPTKNRKINKRGGDYYLELESKGIIVFKNGQ